MENLTLVADAARHTTNLERLRAAGEWGHAISPQKPPIVETVLGGRSALWPAAKYEMEVLVT